MKKVGNQSFLGVGEKRETKPQKQSMTFQAEEESTKYYNVSDCS